MKHWERDGINLFYTLVMNHRPPEALFVLNCLMGKRCTWQSGGDTNLLQMCADISKGWPALWKYGKNLPLPVSERARREFSLSAAFHMLAQEMLEEITGILRDLEWVVVKGASTARIYYPCAEARVAADVDVIVSSKCFGEAVSRLGRSGFRLVRRGRFRQWAVFKKGRMPELDLVTPAVSGLTRDVFSQVVHVPYLTYPVLTHAGNLVVVLAHLRKNLFRMPVTDILDFVRIREKLKKGEKTAEDVARDHGLYRTYHVAEVLAGFWFFGEAEPALPLFLRLDLLDVMAPGGVMVKEVLRRAIL